MLSPAIGVIFYNWLGFSGFILIEIIGNLLSLGVLLTMKFFYEHEEQEAKIKQNEKASTRGQRNYPLLKRKSDCQIYYSC